MPRVDLRGYGFYIAATLFCSLFILLLFIQLNRQPVFPLEGGGSFELMETVRGRNFVFHLGDRQSMALYRMFGGHVPNRFKTTLFPVQTLSTNSLGVFLNKPITEADFNARRVLNGSFSLSIMTKEGAEFFGLQRAVNFNSATIGSQGKMNLTDEQIIFEFTNSPSAYTRLRMYQTNVFKGKVTVTTNEIHFTPDR